MGLRLIWSMLRLSHQGRVKLVILAVFIVSIYTCTFNKFAQIWQRKNDFDAIIKTLEVPLLTPVTILFWPPYAREKKTPGCCWDQPRFFCTTSNRFIHHTMAPKQSLLLDSSLLLYCCCWACISWSCCHEAFLDYDWRQWKGLTRQL